MRICLQLPLDHINALSIKLFGIVGGLALRPRALIVSPVGLIDLIGSTLIKTLLIVSGLPLMFPCLFYQTRLNELRVQGNDRMAA
jgi:hypothetical protein